MLKKTFLAILFICCLLFAVGCGNSEPGLGDENSISIEVVNKTEDIIISHALFYGSGLDEWGEDMLGDEVIEPGEIFTFILPLGNYTLIPMTYELYIFPGVRNINDDTVIEIGGNGLVPVLVRNNTEMDIAFLYMAASTGEDFDDDTGELTDEVLFEELELAEDILGDEILPSGLGRFFFIEPGVYNFLGLHYDGEVILFDSGVVIEGGATITVE